ncbi:MAG TPA: class I SAM-dependent methyltransferase [Bacteroidia bacterium]
MSNLQNRSHIHYLRSMGLLRQSKDFLKYRITSGTKYDVHSPFVFDLLTNVINDKKNYPAYNKAEALRKKLLKDDTLITVTDLGAGSRKNIPKAFGATKKRVKDICRNAEKNKKYGQLLFRLVDHFKPQLIFDLGTSLGVTTLYLSEAAPSAKIISIEGCPQTAAIAQKNFDEANAHNIQLVNANFDDVLENLLDQNCKPQTIKCKLFFFDGNHRKEPTLRYFEQCLQYSANNDVMIFDDIHWSGEMQEAWETIMKNESITVTIDLFFMGIAFLRKEQVKQDFVLRF